jgi:hypothetical protein
MAHLGVFRRHNAIDCGKLPLREWRVGAKRTSDYRG